MLKWLIPGILLCTLPVAARPPGAGGAQQMYLRGAIAGNLTFDVPYSNQISAGPEIGLGFDFGSGVSHLSAILTYSYQAGELDRLDIRTRHFDIWNGRSTELDFDSDIPWRLQTISAEIRFRFNEYPSEPSFYLLGGGGYSIASRGPVTIKGTEIRELTSETSSSPHFNLGIGIDWPDGRSRVSWFAELAAAHRLTPLLNGPTSFFGIAKAGVRLGLGK